MDTPEKIIWLASYPKSGNTWFRAFLTALMNEGELNINDMKTDGIFSSRHIFNHLTGLDSTCLYDEEIRMLQPRVFTRLAAIHTKEQLFIKIHDAYSHNTLGQPIVPAEGTRCVIYIIRNPLDIAPSLANHSSRSIDKTIEALNNEGNVLAPQKNNLNVQQQLQQFIRSWSGHVVSWVYACPLPVCVVRYEDMLLDPHTAFDKALRFAGLHFTAAALDRAIRESSFDNLKKQESVRPFRETLSPGKLFFRSGRMQNWKNELTEEQANSIIACHGNIMERFGYLV